MRNGATSLTAEQEIHIPRPTIDALRHELERLAGLVDDLFALARVETGALQLQIVPTDVAALVREVAALLRPLAQRESAITLTANVPPDLPLAMVDADRLRQILANLVRNAIRHTPEGGIIALSVSAEGPWVMLHVADTGEGIPAEHLPLIFDRFYRVDQARSRASGGAGLGLAIVREFVEGMGGHVTVESVVGEGTCFHVSLAAAGATHMEAGKAFTAWQQPTETGIGT
jgi:signal transduction histidine kinase